MVSSKHLRSFSRHWSWLSNSEIKTGVLKLWCFWSTFATAINVFFLEHISSNCTICISLLLSFWSNEVMIDLEWDSFSFATGSISSKTGFPHTKRKSCFDYLRTFWEYCNAKYSPLKADFFGQEYNANFMHNLLKIQSKTMGQNGKLKYLTNVEKSFNENVVYAFIFYVHEYSLTKNTDWNKIQTWSITCNGKAM